MPMTLPRIGKDWKGLDADDASQVEDVHQEFHTSNSQQQSNMSLIVFAVLVTEFAEHVRRKWNIVRQGCVIECYSLC